MSSKIEIDFNSLKYNLYELLNVEETATDKVIKNSFMKIIKTFHPDKNSELEEDIYHNIILANQILLNPESRLKYDLFLNEKALTHLELKDSFKKTLLDIPKENNDQLQKKSQKYFDTLSLELNKKHGYDESKNSITILDKFNKIKIDRDEVKIEKEDIKTTKEFNDKFSTAKVSGRLKDQIIEYKGELTSYNSNDNYTNLSNINDLYVEGSILSDRYSSLDLAFNLLPVVNHTNTKSIEEKMKEYKTDSEKYGKYNFTN